jgi:hypothetical protein
MTFAPLGNNHPLERGELPENDPRLRDRTRKRPVLPAHQLEALADLRLSLPPEYKPTVELRAHRMELPDIRPDVSAHPVSVFTAHHSPDESFRSGLPHLIGNNTRTLLLEWGNRLWRSDPIPKESRIVLLQNAHCLDTRPLGEGETYCDRMSTHLAYMGLSLAPPAEATIVCAAAIALAQKAGLNLQRAASTWANTQRAALGQLSPEVQDLLTKLRQGGINTSSGGMHINEIGRLCALHCYTHHPLYVPVGMFPIES